MNEEFFEPELIKTILLIVQKFLQKDIFSLSPENIVIERIGRDPIYPCGRYGPEGLDLSQLEWAAKEGKFWFLGPFKDLKIIIDKGPIQGDLQLEVNKMIFTTSLNTLNYDNFGAVAKALRTVAQQNGLELEFQSIDSYSVKLVVSSEASLSVDNVIDFIDKLHVLHKSTDDL